jgi:SAM-dependent methyltransferase
MGCADAAALDRGLSETLPRCFGGPAFEVAPPSHRTYPLLRRIAPLIAVSWRVFGDLVERYDSWYARNNITYENELDAVAALGLRGLGAEIGVGTGRFASKLGARIGIDLSEGMLRAAAGRGVEVLRAPAERLPLRASSLDYVLFVVTLCFLDDPAGALVEARRALRGGGVVAACIVPADSEWGRYYASKGGPFYRLARFYTTDELQSMMRSAGLDPDTISSTLSYGPLDAPHRERPSSNPRAGFVCIRSRAA